MSDFDTFIDTLKKNIEEDGLKLDGAVHAAGIVEPRPLLLINKEHLFENFNVHFSAFVAILKLAASKEYFNDNASIVGLSSSHTLTGQKSNSVYTAMKAAINNLAMSAASELKNRGIRVNTICAGGVKTEMILKLAFNNAETLSQLPNDLLESFELADSILALMSESMKYVTGVNLNVGFIIETENA